MAKSNGYNSENVYVLPHVGKAKMRLRGITIFGEIVNKQLKNVNKLRPPKRTLAIPTWGQKCTFSKL